MSFSELVIEYVNKGYCEEDAEILASNDLGLDEEKED